MNKELWREWLKEGERELSSWLEDNAEDREEHIHTMSELSYKLQHNEIENLDDLKALLSKLDISFFSDDSFNKLWKRYNFKENTLEEHLIKFKHLLNKEIPIDIRINKALNQSKYQIKNINIENLTYLVALNEPQKYICYEYYYVQGFIDTLNIQNIILKKQQNYSFGEFYKVLHEVLKEEVLEEFSNFYYGKDSSKVQNIELQSKISLLYELETFICHAVYNQTEAIRTAFVDKFILKDFYTIKNIEFKDLKNKKIIFLLGENGVGKTVLLKGLLMGLKNIFLRDYAAQEDVGVIFQTQSDNKDLDGEVNVFNDTNEYNLPNISFPEYHKMGIYLKNCYAYGTQRNNVSETKESEEYGFLTLFPSDKYNIYITNVEFWLQDLKFQELENRDTIRVKDFEVILQDLLDLKDLKLTVNSKEVKFKINGQDKSFRELSEGYQIVINLVTDLTRRLVENNKVKNIEELKAVRAVVLIDELDLFLHPKWEKSICGKLHEKFPNIQFFLTTHSPILVDGAIKDKRIDNEQVVIYKLGLEDGATVIEGEPYTGDLIEDWTLNLLINSKLFDDKYLDDIDKENVKELRSSESEGELLRIGKSLKVLKSRSEELKERYLQSLKNT